MFFKKKKTFFLKDNLKEEIEKGFLKVGDWSYGDIKIYRFDNFTKIIIGKFCSIAPNVTVYLGGNHRLDWISAFPFPEGYFNKIFPNAKNIKDYNISKGDLIIGNDVWIGAETTILSGITIGDGAVIAAGSFVNKDVKPYTVSGGVPNKEIKKRFSKKEIDILLKVKWWKFSNKIINDLLPVLNSNNFKLFFNKIKSIRKLK